MRNPNKYIKKAYKNLLDDMDIPLYDQRVPANIKIKPGDKYLLISGIGKSEADRTKCDNAYNVAFQLDIIVHGERGYVDTSVLDDLEEEITDRIFPSVKQDIDLSEDGFICYNTFLDQNVDLPIDTPTETILRRILRFRHVVGELELISEIINYPFAYPYGY
jgi:hypothetical protein